MCYQHINDVLLFLFFFILYLYIERLTVFEK